mmetsp:Transcript_15564/g.42031  ORF Transcript_15564/g.42031 Transcript_15564/m.42031 type:complete len:232 (+) Transcript_15564:328-1023(+)
MALRQEHGLSETGRAAVGEASGGPNMASEPASRPASAPQRERLVHSCPSAARSRGGRQRPRPAMRCPGAAKGLQVEESPPHHERARLCGLCSLRDLGCGRQVLQALVFTVTARTRAAERWRRIAVVAFCCGLAAEASCLRTEAFACFVPRAAAARTSGGGPPRGAAPKLQDLELLQLHAQARNLLLHKLKLVRFFVRDLLLLPVPGCTAGVVAYIDDRAPQLLSAVRKGAR